MRIPELLAPAGGMEALRAAVENAADAVYLGGQLFNARAGAANFSREELREAVEYAHLRGVKIYVTVNILVDNGEIPELVEYVHYLYSIGTDALILQDLGIAYLLRRILPELPQHASTQMTIVNSQGVKLLQELGFERIVLARETSLQDMNSIYEQTGAELEVFVHGALCVCYSGQCLMSSMIGGRSGNRGRCAQPCRLTYRLVDLSNRAEIPDIEVGEHLLSPKDLNLLDQLAELSEAGVASLKVEGRMKRPEYVATVIRNYRQVLDRLDGGRVKGTAEEHGELAQIFNREFTSGYLFGAPGKDLMSYKRPNNRGILLGRVQKYDRSKGKVLIKLEAELAIGDGIEVWVKSGRQGVYVQHIWREGSEISSAVPGEQVWIEVPGQTGIGDRVFKTHDEKLVQKARLSYQEGKAVRRIPIDFTVSGELGQPLEIQAVDADGNQGQACTTVPLAQALKRPISEEYLIQQLDRLGNTPFALRNVQVDLRGELIVPVREINEVRRQAVEQVMAARLTPRAKVTLHEVQARFTKVKAQHQPKHKVETKLSVAVGDLRSLEKAAKAGAGIIYFGGDQFRSKPHMQQGDLAKGIELCKRYNANPVVRLPRMVPENRLSDLANYMKGLQEIGVKSVQAPDLGSLAMAVKNGKFQVYADYELNIFNNFTLRALAQYGVKLATLSPELNLQQLGKMDFIMPFELIVHGALPLMISEYCALGALLGGGKRERCSMPCKAKRFGLKDRKNFVFPVESDQNCRMYIYNAKEINVLEHLDQLAALHPAALRLDLQKEIPEVVERVVRLYSAELERAMIHPKGYKPTEASLRELMQLRPDGYTKGHYFRGVLN